MALASIGGVPHLSSKISLVFASSEIRYEGSLYSIDTKNSTITLAKVKSFGTEDRPTDCPAAPRDEVHEYTIFRGTDIKDICICQPAIAPTGDKKETLKFGGEYDFDKANDEFKEVLEKLEKSSLESNVKNELKEALEKLQKSSRESKTNDETNRYEKSRFSIQIIQYFSRNS